MVPAPPVPESDSTDGNGDQAGIGEMPEKKKSSWREDPKRRAPPGAKDARRFQQEKHGKKPDPPPGMDGGEGFLDGKKDPWSGKLPSDRAEEVRKKTQENRATDGPSMESEIPEPETTQPNRIPEIPESLRERMPARLVQSWEGGYPLFFIRNKRGECLPRFAWVTRDRSGALA